MAGITSAQAAAALARWVAADEAVATGQEYSIGGRSLTRADAKEIRENIDYWDDKCKELAESVQGLVISQVSPTDG
jgi:hypothetical protein